MKSECKNRNTINLLAGEVRDFEHNRDGYTNAKTAFIREVTEKAR